MSGLIPTEVQQCQKLFELRLSDNSLTGHIPLELGTLTELQVILDLSSNNLSGEIPESLGNLMKLERLNLSNNHLQGQIPPSLGKLSSLDSLDVSYNLLQGQLPSSFSSFPLSNFLGNKRLCGPPLARCSGSSRGRGKWLSKAEVDAIIFAIVFTTSVICLVMIYIMLRIWSTWRKVAVSNNEGIGNEIKEQDQEKWLGYGNEKQKGGYSKMNPENMPPSPDKQLFT